MWIIIIILGLLFLVGLYGATKELFTTKKPVDVVNGKVVYVTIGNHWLYNFISFLLIVFILSGIMQIFSYYLN